MARTLLNNAQLKQLLTADKVHARSLDIEGASPLTGSLVGADMFVVQGAGEIPTMITATQMAASGLFGGATTVTVTEDDAQNTSHRITFVDAGASGAGQSLQVDTDSLTYNPVSDTLNIQTASLNAISGTAGAGQVNIVNSASISGDVTIGGNLTVNGVQTIVNSTTIELDDKNIELAKGLGDDAAINGAGITIDSSDGDKTFTFEASGDNFLSSENLSLGSGKVLKMNGTEVLSSTTLTFGSATMVEADLEKVEDITAGAAAASKAVVLDASKNVKDINSLGVNQISASVADLTVTTGGTSGGNMTFFAKGGTVGSHTGYIFSASNSDKGHVIITGDSSNDSKMEFEAGGSIGVIKYDGSSGFDLQGAGGITVKADSGNATFQYSGGAQLVISSTKPKFELQSGNGSGINGRHLDFSHNFTTAGTIRAYKDTGGGEHEFEIAGVKHLALSASEGTLVLSGSDGIRVDGTGVADTTVVASDKLYFRDSDGLMKTDAVSDVLELAFADRVVEKVYYDGVGGANNGAVGRMSSNLLTASLDVSTDGNVISGSLQVFLNGMLQHLSSAAGVTPPTDSAGAFIFDYRTSGSAAGTQAHINGDGFTDTLPSAICLDSALDADDVLTIRYIKK